MYEYITELLDFAEKITLRIVPGEFENSSYFMTLVYIEDILDKYGRGMISMTAADAGLDGHAMLAEANRRMDSLRKTISELNSAHEYDEALKSRAIELTKNWVK